MRSSDSEHGFGRAPTLFTYFSGVYWSGLNLPNNERRYIAIEAGPWKLRCSRAGHWLELVRLFVFRQIA